VLKKPINKTIDGVWIFGNGHSIPVCYFYDLSEHWQKRALTEYSWIDDSDTVSWDDCQFFVYKNWLYSLADFLSVNNSFYNPNCPSWQSGFDGYLTDSFFSGILIKYPNPDDMDYIQAYTFYS